MSRLSRLMTLILLSLWLTGCATAPKAPAQTHGDAYASPIRDPGVALPADPEPEDPEPPPVIRLAFVGDILLGDSLSGILAKRGADYPWQHVAPILREADLAIGNLETAVSTRGTPVPDKQFTFRSHPSTLAGATGAGIDILSLANNHSRDYGPEALLDTIRHLDEAQIRPVGAGKDLPDAARPVIVEVRGVKLAFLAFSRVIPETHWVAWEGNPGLSPGWDPKVVLEALRQARQEADLVIVLLHWGEEVKDEPRPIDVALAHQLIEGGATLVVGHHPHILQRLEWREGRLVAYSLGNFIFPSVPRPLNQETSILEVTLSRVAVTEARLTPFVMTDGQPRPATEESARRILERLDRLSRRCGTRVAPSGVLSPAREPSPPEC